jgi:hypothetical protein
MSAEVLEPLDLILDPISNTALQDIGDVRVELAVLMPQRGDRHHHRRLDLMEVPQDFPQLPLMGSSCGSGDHDTQHIVLLYEPSTRM